MNTAVCPETGSLPRALNRDLKLTLTLAGDLSLKELFRANLVGVITVVRAHLEDAIASGVIDAVEVERLDGALGALQEALRPHDYTLAELYVLPRKLLAERGILKHCRDLAAEGLTLPFLDEVPPGLRARMEDVLFGPGFLQDADEGGSGDLTLRELYCKPRKSVMRGSRRHILTHISRAKEAYVFGFHQTNAAYFGYAPGVTVADKTNNRAWRNGMCIHDGRTNGLFANRVNGDCSIISDVYPRSRG